MVLRPASTYDADHIHHQGAKAGIALSGLAGTVGNHSNTINHGGHRGRGENANSLLSASSVPSVVQIAVLEEVPTMTDTRSSPAFDSQKAEAFAGRLMGALNSSALCLMASIGHRTGLFDAMREQPLMTSGEIATRAGLNERYVREWLGAMVTAGVIDVDPPTLTFTLPPEHAAFLTRPAGADNIGVFTQ